MNPQPGAHPDRAPLLLRSYRKQYPRAVRGEGVYLWDDFGNRYLDLASSAVVNFIGHGVPEIGAALAAQSGTLEFAHSSQFQAAISEQFACELLDFLGPEYRDYSVFLTSGGSEAVETALKVARQYQCEVGQADRTRIVSRSQSYHGATFGAMAVSGNPSRKKIYEPMLRRYPRVRTPYCYRCPYDCEDCGQRYARELEEVLSQDGATTAAFIYEPVSGATLGAASPPPAYLSRVHQICESHGVLTIADEVMTGMGRTGKPLATQHWGVTPDIVVLAKGLASGYAPLGATVVSRRIVEAIARGSGSLVHGFTYNAHPVAAAAGRAVLKIIRQRQLLRNAEDTLPGAAGHLKDALVRLRKLETVGDIRGLGLLWAVEFVRERSSKQPFPAESDFSGRVARASMTRGIVVYPMQGCVNGCNGDHILIAPPAVISHAEIDSALEGLAEAIATCPR